MWKRLVCLCSLPVNINVKKLFVFIKLGKKYITNMLRGDFVTNTFYMHQLSSRVRMVPMNRTVSNNCLSLSQTAKLTLRPQALHLSIQLTDFCRSDSLFANNTTSSSTYNKYLTICVLFKGGAFSLRGVGDVYTGPKMLKQ